MAKAPSHRVPRAASPRRMVTFALLLTSLLIVFVAQKSFSRPGMWRWAMGPTPTESGPIPQKEPGQANINTRPSLSTMTDLYRLESLFAGYNPAWPTPGAVAGPFFALIAQDYLPLPDVTPVQKPRRAPDPDQKLLTGAADREPFLTEPSDAIPELQASARAAQDASARYHLLQLARESQPGSLQADARSNVRFEALRQKPEAHRGELITIAGDLVSIGEPIELHRKVPGLEFCYLGVLVGERPEHQYLLLFTDLPAGLPTNRAEWNQLYLHQVKFTGYFYKVAKFVQVKGKQQIWHLPVLVGKSPQLPVLVEAHSNWVNLLFVFGAMAIPVVLIALLLPKYFRHREARHQRLMDSLRARQSAREISMIEQEVVEEGAEARPVSGDQLNRLRDRLTPPEWN